MVGVSGYVAAIECNNVHEDLPNSVTSGGSSWGYDLSSGLFTFFDSGVTGDFLILPLANWKSSKELQVRHLN